MLDDLHFFTDRHPCPPGLVVGQPLAAEDPDRITRVVVFLCAPAMLASAPRVTAVARLMLSYDFGQPFGGCDDYAAAAVAELNRGGVVGLVFACAEDAETARAWILSEIAAAGSR